MLRPAGSSKENDRYAALPPVQKHRRLTMNYAQAAERAATRQARKLASDRERAMQVANLPDTRPVSPMAVPAGWMEQSVSRQAIEAEALFHHLAQFSFPPNENSNGYPEQGGRAYREPRRGSLSAGEQRYTHAVEAQRNSSVVPHSVLLGFSAEGQPVWNSPEYNGPYLPCPECLFFECPNATGEYSGCPYGKVYDVPDRYDHAYVRSGVNINNGRYGYEHLPVSSNPRGWTFENTGCRLYALGLKSLAPITREAQETIHECASKEGTGVLLTA
ncbi:hypothetical protein C8R43DRAFT_1115858 [Mycena crocata]|nr:hypothetical protein C8R43DRAFT_1115858 [Mycena crocata]